MYKNGTISNVLNVKELLLLTGLVRKYIAHLVECLQSIPEALNSAFIAAHAGYGVA